MTCEFAQDGEAPVLQSGSDVIIQPLGLLNGRTVGKGTCFQMELLSQPTHEIPEMFFKCGPWVQVADVSTRYNDDLGWLLAHVYTGHLARFHMPFVYTLGICGGPCCACTYTLSTYKLSDLLKDLSPEDFAKSSFESLMPDIYDHPDRFFRSGFFEVRSSDEAWQNPEHIRSEIQKVLQSK